MISERMHVAMAMARPQTICAICQIKFCLRCAASLYAHHDKKHLLQHFTTKNLVAEQFYQKTPQISKKNGQSKDCPNGLLLRS